jgi:hypothetical protein
MNKNNKTLREAIRKEIKQALNEGSKENKVADLYAYAGINTKYSNDMIERYGQAAVDLAIEMAPEMIKFKKKLKDFAKEIKTSPEGKMLMNVAKAGRGYGGDHRQVTLGNLFDNL